MTPAQLADKLRQLGQRVPEAVEDALVEGGLMLEGRLVQREIAAARPQPVDQGQYKAGWQSTPVPGGIVVGNSTKHAVFIERGRGPGPVPFAPILEWVQRKKLARASLKAKRVAARAGRAPRPKTPRGATAAAPKTPSAPTGAPSFGAHMKRAQAKAKRAAAEQAEAVRIALAVQRKIAQQGIEPKWILKRAMLALRAPLGRIIKAKLRAVKP